MQCYTGFSEKYETTFKTLFTYNFNHKTSALLSQKKDNIKEQDGVGGFLVILRHPFLSMEIICTQSFLSSKVKKCIHVNPDKCDHSQCWALESG